MVQTSLIVDEKDIDKKISIQQLQKLNIGKMSILLIWMDLFRMKDNFEFLVEDIDKVTSTYFSHFEFQTFISGERYDDSFEENNYLTLAEKIFFEYLEECNPLTWCVKLYFFLICKK